jgi:hypothetical protein
MIRIALPIAMFLLSFMTACGGPSVACHYPSNVDVNANPSGPGCFAGPARQICQVTNGATVLPDGGVSGGTESCRSLCGASQYEMTCTSATLSPSPIPAPASSLGCQIIPILTPSDVLFYCCPCSE